MGRANLISEHRLRELTTITDNRQTLAAYKYNMHSIATLQLIVFATTIVSVQDVKNYPIRGHLA